MSRAICIVIAVAALTSAALGQGQEAQVRKTLDTYCTGCHNARTKAGGVAFDSLSLDALHENAAVWEATLRKLRGRQMPPPGSPQPDQREIDALTTWMEAALDGARVRPVAGHVPVQRLTRTEFGAAVSDLLAIELDAEQLLPAEVEVHGFDNIAAAQSVSPAFLDQYVAAARHAARLAVGESVPKVTVATYPQPAEGDQPGHIDGLPLGTRGGMSFRHHFPADGEYRFTIPNVGVDLYTRAIETQHTLILVVAGREVFRASIGGPDDLKIVERTGVPGQAEIMKRFANIPVQLTAGTWDVGVTFIERARVESDEFVGFLPGDAFSRGDRAPRVQGGVQVTGVGSPGTELEFAL